MPIVLGHEFTGEVVEVGAIPKSMGLFKPGDRVVVNPVQHCNACYACASGHTNLCANLYVPGVNADGAFAEYALSRYTGLFKLDDAVSYAAGAFIEPLACAVYGMKKLAIEPGQFVAIFGPGPIGIMMMQMAKAHRRGQGGDDRHPRLPPGRSQEVGRRLHLQHQGREVALLRQGPQGRHRRRDARPAGRSRHRPDQLQRSVRAGDRHHRRRARSSSTSACPTRTT